ncbi:MAG: carbon-nitrogen hydrolase family protein [Candidatus Latescibacteria bacterium]|nr:carbon-nitrogen hydrolase family protein [Candidatus Latescibacterota bacterium]
MTTSGDPPNALPRQVWITALTQEGIAGASLGEVCASAVAKMESLASFRPDIVCLPETFHTAGLTGPRPTVAAAAETPPGPLTRPFIEFAQRHACYVVCPIYTREGERCYNAAVLIDRQGRIAGEYRKIHPTESEIEDGVAPGPEEPPVFDTDFGRIGIQICFDIQWEAGWRRLGELGTELVFWPSAFAGGQLLNARARENHYCVVSSTQKDEVKLCDLTGEELCRSGRWQPWGLSAPLNLERALLHTWPYAQHFAEMQARYGRQLRIHTLHAEELTLVESLSPQVRVGEVLREFGIKTHREHIASAQEAQVRCRER